MWMLTNLQANTKIGTEATIHLQEGTITSRLPFALSLQEHGPLLQQYIQTKNQWIGSSSYPM